MFTGLVQKVGTLVRLEQRGEGSALVVAHTPWDEPLQLGESVAVQGCCLTVTTVHAEEFECDCLQETLTRTNLGAKQPGAALNLERALRVTDRLGGHFVAAHVDGLGRILGIESRGRDVILEIAAPSEITAEIVVKGSIACDGVSLTVVHRQEGTFTVHIIPSTWEHTSLKSLVPGGTVNLETDMLGKYVHAYVAAHVDTTGGLSMEDLHRAGFG
jgi:riboflavin synthase